MVANPGLPACRRRGECGGSRCKGQSGLFPTMNCTGGLPGRGVQLLLVWWLSAQRGQGWTLGIPVWGLDDVAVLSRPKFLCWCLPWFKVTLGIRTICQRVPGSGLICFSSSSSVGKHARECTDKSHGWWKQRGAVRERRISLECGAGVCREEDEGAVADPGWRGWGPLGPCSPFLSVRAPSQATR